MENRKLACALATIVTMATMTFAHGISHAADDEADEIFATPYDEKTVWQLYTDAAAELARGHRDEAKAKLESLIAEYPEHPAHDLAQELLRVIAEQEPARAQGAQETQEATTPYLGIAVREDSTGLQITRVLENSPSDGLLLPGDVLVSVDGNVLTDKASLEAILKASKRGAPLDILVRSGSGSKAVRIIPTHVAGETPEPPKPPRSAREPIINEELIDEPGGARNTIIAPEARPKRLASLDDARAKGGSVMLEANLGDVLRNEQPTGLARAELVTGQTLHGALIGLEACAFFECEDARAFVGLPMLGAGAGLGLSLWLSSDGITSGHAAIINSGTEWGFWNSLALMYGVAYDADGTAVAGALILGQAAGVGGGELLYQLFEPSSGDVSLASSGGIWAGVLTALVLGIAGADMEEGGMLVTLAMSDLGIVGGAFLASEYPMSRGRVLLIDLGGAVGLLFGAGADVMLQGDDAEGEGVLAAGAIGAAVGLALTTYLTSGWDIPDAPLQVALLPTDGGGQVLIGLDL